MRLIDADKLRAELLSDCINCPNNGTKHCHLYCELNYYTHLIDLAPTVENIISATDFKKRLDNMEYIYLQVNAEDIIDAIDCEVTYFKEKQNGK